ncbi:MAG: hypothetical protein Q7J03_02780 [Methanoregula sp.]|nr:hypothetical protein [Methanoregula sp.]
MMITRLAEIVHEWMGWCPNTQMMKVKESSDTGFSFAAGNPSAKSPGPSEGSGSRDRKTLYERTQRGTVIIWLVTAVAVSLLASMYLFGIVWVTAVVFVIMIVVLAITSTLTVSVSDETLRLHFGPVGLIRKSWPLADIVSVTSVTNPWYTGWGVRITSHGILYNVSGYGAVEVRLVSGKTFRIGSGEPDALCTAIGQAIAKKSPGK